MQRCIQAALIAQRPRTFSLPPFSSEPLVASSPVLLPPEFAPHHHQKGLLHQRLFSVVTDVEKQSALGGLQPKVRHLVSSIARGQLYNSRFESPTAVLSSSGSNRRNVWPSFQWPGQASSFKRSFASGAENSAVLTTFQQYSDLVKAKAAAYFEALPKRAYLKSLRNVLNTVPEAEGEVDSIMKRIVELQGEAFKKHQGLIKDTRGAAHLQMASLVLASYRAVLPIFAHKAAVTIDLIREPVGAAAADTVNLTSRFVLLLTPNKFAHVSRGLDYLGRDFGKSFDVAHTKKPREHSLKVTRCLYNTFFELEGEPELTKLFCAFDRMWFDHISPKKHGIEFLRPKTLADGASACEFVVRRR